jgi:hypothetical protein
LWLYFGVARFKDLATACQLAPVDLGGKYINGYSAFYHKNRRGWVTHEMSKVWAGNVSSFSLSLLRRPILQ